MTHQAATLVRDLMAAVMNLESNELACLEQLARDPAIARSAVLASWLKTIVAGELARRDGATVQFACPDFGRIRAQEAAAMLVSCAVLVEGVCHIPKILDLACVVNKFACVVFGARLLEKQVTGSN